MRAARESGAHFFMAFPELLLWALTPSSSPTSKVTNSIDICKSISLKGVKKKIFSLNIL